MKVLITGANGQVGSYLAELYLQKGWEVHGTTRQRANLEFLKDVKSEVNLHLQDIRDPHGVFNLVERLKPNVIHHMAAMSYVPYSWENPLDTFETNVLGTINFLEAVRKASQATVVQFAGSSEEYGKVPPSEVPMNEETKVYPASPYGVSKLTGDFLFQQYHTSYGMHTVITRAFNHTSPRRGNVFVSKTVVMQALEIKHGLRERFELGNLDAIRDFSDCRDVVEAYYLSVTHPKVKYGQPYVVASGKGHSVRQLVDIVAELTGVSNEVEQDPAKMRPSDAPNLTGDPTLFKKTTGWAPKYEFRDTLKWMLETLEAQLY
jgi:GDP-4-dehydro-6-deoxy-D-mannose reductase